MVSDELVAELRDAKKRVPNDTWQKLAHGLARFSSSPDAVSIQDALGAVSNPDARWMLAEAFRKSARGATWVEIAAVMVAVDCLGDDDQPPIELIWTGPLVPQISAHRFGVSTKPYTTSFRKQSSASSW
jgi:hypothetical protein